MIVSGYSNSSVCATNLQTEAKMENVNKKIINLLSALFTLGSRFKECIVLVLIGRFWTPVCITTKYGFKAPSLPSQDSIEQ